VITVVVDDGGDDVGGHDDEGGSYTLLFLFARFRSLVPVLGVLGVFVVRVRDCFRVHVFVLALPVLLCSRAASHLWLLRSLLVFTSGPGRSWTFGSAVYTHRLISCILAALIPASSCCPSLPFPCPALDPISFPFPSCFPLDLAGPFLSLSAFVRSASFLGLAFLPPRPAPLLLVAAALAAGLHLPALVS
jgi:hypothetical protein